MSFDNIRYVRVVKDTTIDILIAQQLKQQIYVLALVMAIIRLCTTYCRITIQYAKQQCGLMMRSQSPLQIQRSNLVYVIMYIVADKHMQHGTGIAIGVARQPYAIHSLHFSN